MRALRVSGELDIATAPALSAALDEVSGPGASITLDLSDLEFIDPAGVRVLVVARRAVGSGGRIVLRHPGAMVRRLLTLIGLDALADGDESERNGRPV